MENGTIKYLTFLSAGRKFAIPFHDIRTVMVAENLQKIPEFPAYFAGTCIWEDRSVPVIDARARFGFEKGEYNNRSCVIICEVKIAATGKTGNVGLLTDTVAEMAEIDPEKLQPCEAVNAQAYTRYLKGVFIDNGESCYIVDAGLMVNDADAESVTQEG